MADISRRGFLKTGAALAAASAVPTALGDVYGRKNVLFISVDDLTTTALGCYGSSVHTPHLDALARRGVCFGAAYCQYPLCNPSRSSLLNGVAPDVTHVYDNEVHFRDYLQKAMTIPELFRKNGYYSARVGKIFHAGNPGDIGRDGYDDLASWDYTFNDAGVDHTKEEPYIVNYTPQRGNLGSSLAFFESSSPDSAITDSRGADEVIRLIKANRDKSFFIAYGLYRPHVPWVVPSAYFDRYPLHTMRTQPFHPEEMKLGPAAAYSNLEPNYGLDEEHCRTAVRAYYASTTFIDTQIGRVFAALREAGLESNTLIVFWGDHGWALGEHGQWQKNMLFEPVARIPFIMAGPGVHAGGFCRRTTEHLDIYPTLVEFFHLENAPSNLQGTSLMPLLKNPMAAWEKPAITQLRRGYGKDKPAGIGYSIRTERYRYTSWEGAQTAEELYDYQTDPREQRNLATDSALQGIKTSLRQQLQSIRKTRST
jgi:uncharacterized sulfatase